MFLMKSWYSGYDNINDFYPAGDQSSETAGFEARLVAETSRIGQDELRIRNASTLLIAREWLPLHDMWQKIMIAALCMILARS